MIRCRPGTFFGSLHRLKFSDDSIKARSGCIPPSFLIGLAKMYFVNLVTLFAMHTPHAVPIVTWWRGAQQADAFKENP